VIKKLNGTIIFLKGNCDTTMSEPETDDIVFNVSQESILTLNKFDCVFCHYPMKNWPGKESGTALFHGHEIYNNETVLTKGCNIINVCTDFWEYRPVKFSQIKSIIEYKM
jgi:calcineurin-like phosphoesterase family protein